MNNLKQNAAFTLFEMVVAMSVTVVIAFFVFSFGSSLSEAWMFHQNKVGMDLDAKIALDTIEADLEGAVFRDGSNVMFAVSALYKETAVTGEFDRTHSTRWIDPVDSNAGRLATNGFNPSLHHYGWAGSWLRFFTAAPSVNAVGYQIIRRESFSGSTSNSYLLNRSVVRQDHTNEAGFNLTEIGTSYDVLPLSDSYPGTIKYPRSTDIFIENVIDFGARLYIYDSTAKATENSPVGMRLIYPADANGVLSSLDRHHYSSTFSGTDYSIRYPDVIEVFLRILDGEGASKLSEVENHGAEGTFEDIVAEHGKLYSRMIEIPGGK